MSTTRPQPHTRASRLLGVLACLTASGSLSILILLLLYIRDNDSNHTGFEPWLLSGFFVPTFILGIAAFLRGSSRWGALLAFCLGFGGMVFLFCIDHFNILVQYDRLGARGGL